MKHIHELVLLKEPRRLERSSGPQTCGFGNLCQHAGTNFVAIMKGEDEVWESGTLKNSMGAASALDAPACPQQSCKHASGLCGGPVAHAASNIRLDGTGSSSPFSMRSAITRNANASTAASAFARVLPYASTPGNSATSAIQRPSVSRSNSTVSFIAVFDFSTIRLLSHLPPAAGTGAAGLDGFGMWM